MNRHTLSNLSPKTMTAILADLLNAPSVAESTEFQSVWNALVENVGLASALVQTFKAMEEEGHHMMTDYDEIGYQEEKRRIQE